MTRPLYPFPSSVIKDDARWFADRPNEAFRICEPHPDEFSPNELVNRDRGSPVVFAIAVRDRKTGAVRRVVRMLRWKLPARGGQS
jgi:hypothetical protein